MAAEGLIVVESSFGASETMDRLAIAVHGAGMTVFARIDHAAGAVAVGMSLRPTALLIFGNPKAGTLLMQADQRVGIDLPLKALVFQDESGTVLIAYNDPGWVVGRHDLGGDVMPNVQGMATVLKSMVEKATSLARG